MELVTDPSLELIAAYPELWTVEKVSIVQAGYARRYDPKRLAS